MNVCSKKRVVEFVTAIMLLYCIFAAVTVSAEVKDKLDTHDPTFAKITSLSYINNGQRVSLGNSFLDVKCSDGQTLYNKGYRVMQGGCIDNVGKNLYYFIRNQRPETAEYQKSALVRVNINTWEVSVLRHNISLGHANDAAYYNGKLVVTHYRNSSKNQVRTLSIIDLEAPYKSVIIPNKQVKLKGSPVGINGIAYEATKKQFAMMISDSSTGVRKIVHVNVSGTGENTVFTEASSFDMSKDASVKKLFSSHHIQGLECSSNGLYVVCSPRTLGNGNYNRIITYGWSGKLNKITLLASTLEGENISRVRGTTNFYVGYCAPSSMDTVTRTGTRIHTFKLTK